MTVVYTTIFGNSDSLKKAPSGASRCVCFVDDPARYAGQTRGWELIAHDAAGEPRREAWRLRCLAHDLFPEARKSVWIDASFTLTNLPRLLLDASPHLLSGLPHHLRDSCYREGTEIVNVGQADKADIQRQLDGYRREGFRPSGLTISCILVREHTPQVQVFNERWLTEIQTHRGDNTQLSLDYCAWKAGIEVYHLRGVRKNNPYAIHDHADHKLRRKPYDTAVAV